MIRIITYFLVVFSSLLFSCAQPMNTGQVQGEISSSPVNVNLNVVIPSASKGNPSRSVSLMNASISAVNIEVTNSTGVVIGSGTLTKGATAYTGTISVSATGQAVFEAYATLTSGGVGYVGKATYNIQASGNSLSIATTNVTPMGDHLQWSVPVLTNTVSSLATGFSMPNIGLATDGTLLYISDTSHNEIDTVNLLTGVKVIWAGKTAAGNVDGIGTAAQFNYPLGMTLFNGNLYVSDYNNGVLRVINTANASVSTLKVTLNGVTYEPGFYSLATDGTNLYVSSSDAVFKINTSTGAVTLVAGLNVGSSDGVGANASFKSLQAMTCDGTYLYVCDTQNDTIRRIEISTGTVLTIAGQAGVSGSADGNGTSATFYQPTGITTDGTNLYIADSMNNTIRKMVLATNAVSTITGQAGYHGLTNGVGTSVLFYGPSAITTDGINLYVSDEFNNAIRLIQ